MLTKDAYAEGRAQGLEEAAELLHGRGRNLVAGRRTNRMDRHVSGVLIRARDDVRALKTKAPSPSPGEQEQG